MRAQLTLSGKVFRDEGMLVAECAELGWSTHAHTLEGLFSDLPRMIQDFFQGYREIGQLEVQLSRLGVAGKPDVVDVRLQLDMRAVAEALRAEQSIEVPIAA